jgi:hypothetical protein
MDERKTILVGIELRRGDLQVATCFTLERHVAS